MDQTPASILVCDRWPLPLLPGTGGHYSFLNTVSSKNAKCFLQLLQGIPQGLRVAEYFGGVGIFSIIIQHILAPRSHYISDLDPDCVAQLHMALDGSYSGVHIEQADARLQMGSIVGEVVVLDFPFCTVRNLHEWRWDRIIEKQPRYIIWSDVALRRLGLHRKLYTQFFGRPIFSHEDYVAAFSHVFYHRFGYSIVQCAHHVYSYFRAEPGLIHPVNILYHKVA